MYAHGEFQGAVRDFWYFRRGSGEMDGGIRFSIIFNIEMQIFSLIGQQTGELWGPIYGNWPFLESFRVGTRVSLIVCGSY